MKIIKVADAAIFPDKGDVMVLKNAQMKTLEHASIIANTTTQFHSIYDASVNVISRKKYEAKGKYDYIDENDKKQQIAFDRVSVDSTLQTFAVGNIPKPDLHHDESSAFRLSDAFNYFGDVRLLAYREFIFQRSCQHQADMRLADIMDEDPGRD